MSKSNENIRKAQKDWESISLAKTTARFPERETCKDVTRFANPANLEDQDFIRDVGFPGTYPYTRGVQPTMYRGRFWTMRQYAGFGTAKESNERYRYLLGQGQTGLSVAFDLPTQIGYDSDDPIALGEVGKVGVAIDTLADMEILFDQIPLDKVSTSMTINASAAVLLAMYIAVAEKRGISKSILVGTIQNDILKEYIARGTYIFPPKPSMRLITDIFEYCAKNVPKWNTISISGYHIREAGSTAIQEVGFTLADGIAYCEAAMKCGMDVDTFGARLSFFFNAHNNLLEEVAKFRAARRLWARIMTDRFKAKSAKAKMLRFHCQTGGSTLTAQQVDNNVVRVAIQALAAVLGGTQSLHTNSKDEALALPTEDSVRVALRTQQIIAHESGVADTIDPLGGSWYIEKLTNEIEEGAMDIIGKIDDIGGMVKAIEEGFVQRQIQDSAYKTQRLIDSGDEVVVGVNKLCIDEPEFDGLEELDPAIESNQVEFLTRTKAQRDNAKVEKLLKTLHKNAEGSENLIPVILEAVKEYASLGEICNTLRDVFGEFQESVVL